jgi:GxxExxY protein
MGRFFDERIYQKELMECAKREKFEVSREVLLRVSHKNFSKDYYIDLLINQSIPYELKTVEQLTSHHQKQLIHYLLLANLQHGKLLNFRPSSVESRFVSTQLTHEQRSTFIFKDAEWDDCGTNLKNTFLTLLEDWGCYLDTNLYREAIAHLLKDPDAGQQAIQIKVNGRLLGHQQMYLANASTAFHISALRKHQQSYETHMRRLIKHTNIDQIQWINLENQTVTFKTIERSN